MFDWVDDALLWIQDLFYGMIDFLLDLATGILDTIGLKHCWDMLAGILGVGEGGVAGGPIGALFAVVPLASQMAHWDILINVVHCQFSILASLAAFKITVKLVPTIW